MDLALNNLHWLMCHKTKPNQSTYPIANLAVGRVIRNKMFYMIAIG